MNPSKVLTIDGEDMVKMVYTKAGLRLDNELTYGVRLELEDEIDDSESIELSSLIDTAIDLIGTAYDSLVPRRLYLVMVPPWQLQPIETGVAMDYLLRKRLFNTQLEPVFNYNHSLLQKAFEQMELQPLEITQLLVVVADAEQKHDSTTEESHGSGSFRHN